MAEPNDESANPSAVPTGAGQAGGGAPATSGGPSVPAVAEDEACAGMAAFDAWPLVLDAFEAPRGGGRDDSSGTRTPENNAIDSLFRGLVADIFQIPAPHEWPRPDGVAGLAYPYVALSTFAKELLLVARAADADPGERELAAAGVAVAFVVRQAHDLERLDREARAESLRADPIHSEMRRTLGMGPPPTAAEVEARHPDLRAALEGLAESPDTMQDVRAVFVDALDGTATLDVAGFVRRCRVVRDRVRAESNAPGATPRKRRVPQHSWAGQAWQLCEIMGKTQVEAARLLSLECGKNISQSTVSREIAALKESAPPGAGLASLERDMTPGPAHRVAGDPAVMSGEERRDRRRVLPGPDRPDPTDREHHSR